MDGVEPSASSLSGKRSNQSELHALSWPTWNRTRISPLSAVRSKPLSYRPIKEGRAGIEPTNPGLQPGALPLGYPPAIFPKRSLILCKRALSFSLPGAQIAIDAAIARSIGNPSFNFSRTFCEMHSLSASVNFGFLAMRISFLMAKQYHRSTTHLRPSDGIRTHSNSATSCRAIQLHHAWHVSRPGGI